MPLRPPTALPLALLAAGLLGAAPRPGDQNLFPDGLTGRDIYERVVENRFRSFKEHSTLVSADRAGRAQESRFVVHWQSFRDGDDEPADGVLSKTIVRYQHPFDMRFVGYFIQSNHRRANDQFVYYPSRRRVVRVSLRGEAVYGTDFSFEDVVPRELGDYTYGRLPDEVWQGIPVHVVDLFPEPHAQSEYSRIRVYVDRERYVALRGRYWSEAGVEVKELAADPARVERIEGVWVPMRATMRHLLHDSRTMLEVTALEPNPAFQRDTFDLRRLESH